MNAAEMLVRRLLLPAGLDPKRAETLTRIASGCPRIDIQRIISLVDNGAGKFDYTQESFIPPWKESTLFFIRDGQRIGLSVHRAKLTAEGRTWFHEGLTKGATTNISIVPGPGYVFLMDILFCPKQDSQLVFIGTITVLLNEQGVYDVAAFTDNLEVCSNVPKEAVSHIVDTCALYAYTTFALCHCRNAQICPAPVSRQVRRWAERHKEPVFEHHIIQISGKSPLRMSNSSGHRETQSLRPLHTCRGHFAHYGAQWNTGKLFGKIEGRFYIDDHERGSLQQGVITKDYKVEKTQ